MENADKPESTKRMEITGRFKDKEISLSDWLKLIPKGSKNFRIVETATVEPVKKN